MKKFLSVLLVVIIIAMTCPITGMSLDMMEEVKDPSGQYICYIRDYYESVLIDEYLGDEKDVVIPEEIAGYKVVEIASDAFADNKKITSVVIPETVREIGPNSFGSCTNLESITIKNKAAYIYGEAFVDTAYVNNAKNWEGSSLYLDNFLLAVKPDLSGKYVVKEGTTSIASDMFANYTKLTEVVLPDTVLFIPYGLFENCTSLEKVKLPESAEYISFSAFENCTQLTSVVIPKNVREVYMNAFRNCSNLKNIKIESSDIEVDEWALEGTAYYNEPSNWDNGVLYVDKHVLVAKEDVLKGDYVIKEGTKSISSRAFSGCDKLTKITVPKGVTRIPEDAFASCDNLETVVLSSGVKSVDFCAFEDCENLKDITLPDTIEYIEWRAFEDTGYYNNEKNWENGVLYIGNYLVDVNENFEAKNYTVKKGTRVLGEWAMAGSCELEHLVIPDSVIAINDQAFNQCEKLKTVTIPKSVKEIGKDAFIFCGDVTIKGYENSYAEKYAALNNMTFVSIDVSAKNENNDISETTTSAKVEEATKPNTENEIVTTEKETEYNDVETTVAATDVLVDEECEDTTKQGVEIVTYIGILFVTVVVAAIGLVICKKNKK